MDGSARSIASLRVGKGCTRHPGAALGRAQQAGEPPPPRGAGQAVQLFSFFCFRPPSILTLTSSLMYTFSDLGAVRCLVLLRPPASRSMPWFWWGREIERAGGGAKKSNRHARP